MTTPLVNAARGEYNRVSPPSQWYFVCGLPVRSEVPLPLPRLEATSDEEEAWTIRLASNPESMARPTWDVFSPLTSARQADATPDDENGVAFHHFQHGADGTWIWWDGLATLRVSSDGRVVDVFRDPAADPLLLGLLLAGPLTAIVASFQGRTLLHASAVVAGAGAIAFLGPKGQGKSTLAAAFLSRGASLLTDDMLLLLPRPEGILGAPGPSVMKVWRATAERTLGLDSDSLPSVSPTIEKKLLNLDARYPVAQRPEPLRRLYLLDRYDPRRESTRECSFRRLSGSEALIRIAGQTYGPILTQDAVARALPTYARLAAQARVSILRFPSGFEWQDRVCELVSRDLEEQ